MMPGAELPYFIDALEWVSNPDHEADDQLLEGAECWVYRAPFLGEGAARAHLARRVEDETPVPYMIYFLASDGLMVQLPLPMCLRDAGPRRPVDRAARAGPGGGLRARVPRRAVPVRLPLAVSGRPQGRGRRASSITT